MSKSKNIDGNKLSEILYQELNNYLQRKPIVPKIVDISVGEEYSGLVYSKMKQKVLSKKTNINFKSIHFDKITYQELILYINKLNIDKDITGIIIQLPLPDYLKSYTREILDTILPSKDIDGLTSTSIGLLNTKKDCLISCTALAIETILKSYNVSLEGKSVAILNRNTLIGLPLTQLMLRNNATPIICHSKTKNLESITKNCDIVVVAINKKEYITKKYIKEESIVIDTGVHRNNLNKIVGDIDYNNIKNQVSLITPPTGGVGPITICMLSYNAAKCLYGKEVDQILFNAIKVAQNTL